jgi:hypothetical protein
LLTAAAERLPADRIYLKATSQAPGIEGQSEAAIHGVVLQEEAGLLTIRVEGGPMVLTRDRIERIEADGLTEAQVAKSETAAREALSVADQRRQERLASWAEASARRSQESEPEPQAIEVVVDFQGLLPAQVFRFYEPIIGRIDLNGLGQAIEDYLRAELRRLWNQGR